MPIALSEKEWARITKWASPDKEDPEVVRRREYVEYLDKTSSAMTKSWPNSVENINKRNEEQRLARIAVVEEANSTFYKKYMKRKKEEQEESMYSARDAMFKSKDASKLILSAVIETAIQKERMEQVNFINERRREEAKKKRKSDDQILQQAKEWNELNALRQKRRFEVNKQNQREILQQAREVAERNRNEYETELNLQKIDNIRSSEEMKALKEFDDAFKKKEKLRIRHDIQQAKDENQQRIKEQKTLDKMDDDLIAILNKSKARIEHKRKESELEFKNAKLRVVEAISAKLSSGDAAREAKEQAVLEKAMKEKLDAENARNEKDRRNRARIKQELLDIRQKFLRDEEQRLHDLKTRREFEVMNRFKNVELHEQYKEGLRNEKNRKVKEYKEDMLRLWKERDDREAMELAATRYFYGELAEKKLRDADNKMFTYAANLIEEAKMHGRPALALHKCVDTYCKLNRLYPMPPLYEPIAEHMRHYEPRDRSRLDPSYVEPPPPNSLLQKEGKHDKRTGLQAPKPEAGPSKVTTSKSDPVVEEYKKTGPAYGLQRRNAMAPTKSLNIKIVECTTKQCHCELKPQGK